MSPPVTAATRLIALLGNPVHHSLSPAFQNAAIRAAGRDAVYLALRCESSDVAHLIGAIARAGGAGNVTVPHKEAAAQAIEQPSERVVRTGVCNTFWSQEGVVHGDNTDVDGFRRAAEELLGGELAGIRALVLGAGGAARAAVFALLEARAGQIVIANRSMERAEEIADRFRAGPLIALTSPDAVRVGDHDLVVNATALGLRDADPLPLPLDDWAPSTAALDLVYRPTRTEWINQLRSSGIRAEDGLPMLLYQGAAAFERWFAMPAPLDAMRAALPKRD